MALFGKLFEKKECHLCGGEIGLLGNKKLEDGNMCKTCARKLSPWFDDRRHSTVEQIRRQLAYREENAAALQGFQPAVTYGESDYLHAEVTNGMPTRFVVAKTRDFREENADLIRFQDVKSFDIDVQEYRRELKFRNSEGDMVSYRPPRYQYSYDFHGKILVNNPYFDDIEFKLNRASVNLETVEQGSLLGRNLMRSGFDPMLYPEYRQYRAMCDEVEELFRLGMQGRQVPGYAAAEQPAISTAPVAEPAPASPKFCPECGAPSGGGKFCPNCGTRF